MEHPAPVAHFDRELQVDTVKILPGQCHASSGPGSISTMLGSCVSTCLWDPVTRVGGMNHFMLPDSGDPGNPVSASMRYGTFAMEVLINDLLKAGARREHLEAKVFGGGAVLRGFSALNVGERNATFVMQFLKTERIPVLAEDLNDIYPRKVYFFPRTGKVLVKKLMQTRNDTLERRELDYASRLKVEPVSGAIDLF